MATTLKSAMIIDKISLTRGVTIEQNAEFVSWQVGHSAYSTKL